jgi:tRNA modification GTPase
VRGDDIGSGSGEETIVAISTPPGRGGIGVVRLSGPEAAAIAAPMLRLKHPLVHAQARFAEILDEPAPASPVLSSYVRASSRIDEAIVTFFAAPRSYTGEDLVEIAAHGSPVVLDMLVRGAIARGARLAEPGEFTQRAFLSGRIDLTQAEAVRDLIEAQTLYQARVAASQLGGALSRRVQPAKEALLALIAALEAGIDFAEDDVDVMADAEILARIEAARAQLAPIEASFAQGRIVRGGLTLAIVGRPNVGKSSLFNRLVERERAIVTAAPGTTRDPVAESVSMGGVPVNLIDTAGLRLALDEAEAIGVQKSREAMADADIVLVVVEAGASEFATEMELLAGLEGRDAIVVRNKVDLLGADAPGAIPLSEEAGLGRASSLNPSDLSMLADALPVSALTGVGIEGLRRAILDRAQAGGTAEQSGIVTNLRQHQAISESIRSLAAAASSAALGVPHEMVMLDLYAALGGLDALTGHTTPDDVLHRIFSSFCIGK